jgi:hypothetical protein
MSAVRKSIVIACIYICTFAIIPAHAAELLDTPVYDPASKSYFEMVDGLKIYKGYMANEGPNWEQANEFARARVFGGARGRLAIIASLATHAFLESTFKPGTYVWTGLRYFCASRKLEWSDGQSFVPGAFQAWDARWNQDVYGCQGPKQVYMPIAYSPLPNFRWVGKGIEKRYYYFFVEYPTGHPLN